MALNMIVMQFLDLDFEKLIKEEIAAKGSNRVFLENLIPFVIFLGALLFWVKTVHKQPIKALTTSRKKWTGEGLLRLWIRCNIFECFNFN